MTMPRVSPPSLNPRREAARKSSKPRNSGKADSARHTASGWNWTTKVRFKSTTSTMLGMPNM